MARLREVPPARGDEAELFRAYNDELLRMVARTVQTPSAQTIEDACSFAWAKFMENQPDRERNWRGWLYRVAQRQAWELEGQRLEHSQLRVTESSYVPHTFEAPSPIDEIEIFNDVDEALSILRELPPRLQRIAMLRAMGFKYPEISELTGDSNARVHRLVVGANERVWAIIADRDHAGRERRSPRADRLWDLEHRPPVWLVQKIGRPARGDFRRPSHSELRRAWRRAALALDDYRRTVGPDRFREMTDEPPTEPSVRQLHARALSATRAVECERNRQRRPGREL